jgi:hypothetical protein
MPPSPTTDAALLAARRAVRGSAGDDASLDHFVQVLCRLDAGRHGFGADDLAAVEAAWVIETDESWSGGLVARLKDGRRIHADGRAGASHWSEDADIEAGVLDGGQSLPELAARHGWQDHAWDERIARALNALLDRLSAA